MNQSQNENFTKITELIEDVRINIFVTMDTNGPLRGRPMSTVKVDEEGIWFFTNEYSGKSKEISHNNEVFLSYSSPSKNSYVALNGVASLVNDREKIEELWNPAMKAWFPEGLDDPKIQLIKVTPSSAEYWDSSSNKIVIAYNMLKAAVTGEEYDEGEHGTVKF